IRHSAQVIDVLEGMMTFAIRAGSSLSQVVTLPQTPNTLMPVGVELSAGTSNGFLQGLGFERSGSYDIRVVIGLQAVMLSSAERDHFLSMMRTVQQKLYDAGVFSKQPDGVFGEETVNAVEAYQRKQGMVAVDGVLGPATLSTLLSNQEKREFIAAAFRIECALGAEGLLASEPNGALGPSTVIAIRAFQRKHSLSPDGALGKQTLDAIFGPSK
ncbi:MAG: peptidoglycan-binding protein, partial [Chthoniobacterales bacterium]